MRHDSEIASGFHASAESWVRLALNCVGIDATIKEANDFINWLGIKYEIAESDLEHFRQKMLDDNPTTKLYDRADRLFQAAKLLMLSAKGREAIREAIRRSSKDDILSLLGLADHE